MRAATYARGTKYAKTRKRWYHHNVAPYSNAIDRFNFRNAMTYHGSSLLPDRYNNIMHYRERWSVTDANGYISYIYSMNGAYDPYVPASGLACAGWDKMVFLYKRYLVTASKIQITYVNNDENDPVEISVYPSHDVTSAGDYAPDQPDSRHIVVTNQAGKETITHYRTVKSMSWPIASDDTLSADSTHNPEKQYYWQIRLSGTAATALSGQLEVDIWYYTTWYDREKCDPVL